MLSSYRQPIFGALRDQASDVILTGIPEQQRAITRDRRISDQPESGKHDEVLQMFSLNVDLLTNLPIRPFWRNHFVNPVYGNQFRCVVLAPFCCPPEDVRISHIARQNVEQNVEQNTVYQRVFPEIPIRNIIKTVC